MTARVMDLDELRESLEKEKADAEEVEAALQLAQQKGESTEEELDELRDKYDAGTVKIASLAEAIERKEKMNDALENYRRTMKDDGNGSKPPRVKVGNEPATYRRNGPHSFFKDVFYSREGDPGAISRISRHAKETADLQAQMEQYAMTSASGSGLGFVAPQYLQDEWAALARAARPLADAVRSLPLPASGTAFNIPRVTTGGTAAVQATEGGAVQDNSQVSDTITLNISTIAAKTDMSRQLFDRSDPSMDTVIGQDLAADYARVVDSEIINGPGSGGRVKGILTAAASNAISATATAIGIYPKVADALQRIDTLRFLPANLVVMHPRRWGQFLSTLDTSSRPLVVPNPAAVNPLAVGGNQANVSEGLVGYDLQGVPVLKDANIPTNLGAATNEDRIIVTRKEDLWLFEGPSPVVRVYEEVLSGTLQVRIQVFGYIAFTAERYVNATFLITGLTPPSF